LRGGSPLWWERVTGGGVEEGCGGGRPGVGRGLKAAKWASNFTEGCLLRGERFANGETIGKTQMKGF